jgi:cytoskeletal protein RodZ
MNKTWIWVFVGVLTVASVGAVAFMQSRPRGEPSASTTPAATTSSQTEGGAAVAVEPAASEGTSAASPATTSTAGVATAQSAPATIDELIQNAAAYEGLPVSLSGAIVTQCVAGCEFALDDGTGVLSVQLEGKAKDRLIPLGKVGKKIAIQGVFHAKPRPQIVIEDPNGWQFVP